MISKSFVTETEKNLAQEGECSVNGNEIKFTVTPLSVRTLVIPVNVNSVDFTVSDKDKFVIVPQSARNMAVTVQDRHSCLKI